MRKRILFVASFFLVIPMFILWLPFMFLLICFSPVVWIITGDELKTHNFIFGHISDFIISIPYKTYFK